MNYERACRTLNLHDGFTTSQLKRAYYKKCLQYHPDKNPDGEEEFKQVQCAYEFLRTSSRTFIVEDHSIFTYKDIFEKFINMSMKTTDVKDLLHQLVFSTSSIDWILEHSSEELVLELYSFLSKHQETIPIDIERVKRRVDEIKKTKRIYTLHPTLKELYTHQIYVLEHEKETYYIPLWHHELYFDDFIVYNEPSFEDISLSSTPSYTLPQDVNIDTDNDIHLTYIIPKENLFHREYITFDYQNIIHLQIPLSKCYIKSQQTYTFYHQGIPYINTHQVFNIKKKSNFYIHITIN